jgi:hypothetical protein
VLLILAGLGQGCPSELWFCLQEHCEIYFHN